MVKLCQRDSMKHVVCFIRLTCISSEITNRKFGSDEHLLEFREMPIRQTENLFGVSFANTESLNPLTLISVKLF